MIRRIHKTDYIQALELTMSVFLEYEAPNYTQEGIEAFKKSIYDENYLNMLEMYGAYDDNGELAGIIATRNDGTHIALFFVMGRYHRQGIGRKLYTVVEERARECHDKDKSTDNLVMTVNSSLYAAPVYRKLGFMDTDEVQSEGGVKYIPMRKVLCTK